MSVQQMRDKLKERYHWSMSWSLKVDDMSDAQVIAVYYRLLRKGEIVS